MKNDSWHFPIVPVCLTGLMLEHVWQLQEKIRRHGMLVGTGTLGRVMCLKVKDPGPMTLILIGSAGLFDLLVLDAEGHTSRDLITINVHETKLHGRILWNPSITIADVLTVLDAETVVTTSELSMSSAEGPN